MLREIKLEYDFIFQEESKSQIFFILDNL